MNLKRLAIDDHPETQSITIRGINYSYGLFEAWGIGGMREGRLFELIKRENGVLVIRDVDRDNKELIKNIQKLRLKDGDILVVNVDSLAYERMDKVKKMISEISGKLGKDVLFVLNPTKKMRFDIMKDQMKEELLEYLSNQPKWKKRIKKLKLRK